MGVWPCAKCGALMFSGNLFVHDCRPRAPTLDWDENPREGSEPKAETEGLGAKPAEPGPKDAPNNRSTPEAAPTGEALTDEQIDTLIGEHAWVCGAFGPQMHHFARAIESTVRAALSTHPSAPVAPSTTEREVLAEAYAALYGNSTLVTTNTVTAQAYMRAPEFEWLCIRFNTWEHAHRAHKALHKLEEVVAHPPAVQPVAPAGWKPIETAPKDGRKLILFYRNSNSKARTVMAQWVTDDEAAETDADGVGLEGGWYECIDNWDDYCQVAIHEGEPTHWMPLPATPSAEAPRKSLSAAVADALRPFLAAGQKVIWREPFRWFDDDGVMSNHYDGMSLDSLAAEFGYEVIHDCGCAGVIKRAPSAEAQPTPKEI